MSSPFSKAGELSTKNGPKTVDSVASGGRRLFIPTTSIDSPSTSESRMNSWRLSSVMWPVRVRKSMAANHSSSVSCTSVANACRWLTRLCAICLKRSVFAPSKDATTACVRSSSARLRVLIGSPRAWLSMDGLAEVVKCGDGRARPLRGSPAVELYARAMSVLGCASPLMQAPLGRGAAARLAGEVSQAGGLGTLGASWTEPPVLREQIRSIARLTDRPFCVNLVLDFPQDDRLEVAIEERVPWVSFSFGLRPELVIRAHAGGARVLAQVASADAAGAAAAAGADAVIVQGVEAGGHVQSVVGLFPLLAEVRRAVSLPLLAAGGIADPAPALAALAAGASAVVMGTRFVASDECDAHPRYKARLLTAEGRDTVLTELFDVGWPAPHRVLRNSTYERWQAAGRPSPGQRPGEGETVAEGVLRYAVNLPLSGTDGDVEAMAMYAGQGVGTIDAVEAAGAIVERFAAALRPT